MFYGDVKSAWKPLEMQAWLTKQSKQALSVPTHQSWFVHLCVFLCLNILSFALFSAVLYYPVISCTILWYPVLTCSILLYPVLSCTILYYPELFPTIMYTKSLQLCCICCWHSGLGVGRTLFSLCIQRRFQFSHSRHVHSSWKLWKIGNPVSDICLKSFDKYLLDCHQRAHMYHWWCRTGSQAGPRVPIFHNNLQNFCFECAIIADEANMSSTEDGHRTGCTSSNWSGMVRSCLLGGVTHPSWSGNSKIDPISTPISLPLLVASQTTAQITSGSGMT